MRLWYPPVSASVQLRRMLRSMYEPQGTSCLPWLATFASWILSKPKLSSIKCWIITKVLRHCCKVKRSPAGRSMCQIHNWIPVLLKQSSIHIDWRMLGVMSTILSAKGKRHLPGVVLHVYVFSAYASTALALETQMEDGHSVRRIFTYTIGKYYYST